MTGLLPGTENNGHHFYFIYYPLSLFIKQQISRTIIREGKGEGRGGGEAEEYEEEEERRKKNTIRANFGEQLRISSYLQCGDLMDS